MKSKIKNPKSKIPTRPLNDNAGWPCELRIFDFRFSIFDLRGLGWVSVI
jgi:hypothetical protein